MVKCYRGSVSLSDLWISSHEKLSDFQASSWQRGDSPVPLLVVRMLLATLALGILIWSVVTSPTPYWLVFLTNWGLVLVAMMTVNGLLVSCIAVGKTTFDDKELPWYVSMYWLIFNTTVTIAIMITALYWILLYNPDPETPHEPPSFWLDVSTHAFNSCIALADLLVSRTPVRLPHIYQPLGLGLWYVAFSVIYYVAGGLVNGEPFIYEILDWRQSKRAGTIVGLAMVGLLALYVILWAIALCRDKISTSYIRTRGHDLPTAPPDRHMVV
ncbi:protein rolling stone-like [Manduca sexta]|uniref:Protein rolling stone-like n=1 Tax=Manduca sexta TaxID=7130 RepID=A0A921Z382_MANSE|nr:protein rolling stone-like [Manduca sexta]KAG6450462.1 hypothetical protein O3G_MSEX006614 [Manduca sexta]